MGVRQQNLRILFDERRMSFESESQFWFLLWLVVSRSGIHEGTCLRVVFSWNRAGTWFVRPGQWSKVKHSTHEGRVSDSQRLK